jgi:hypothetical protein
MTIQLVPKQQRVATAGRVCSEIRQMPRCAALTKQGTQCTGVVGSTGSGGTYRVIDGEKVPLCGKHMYA